TRSTADDNRDLRLTNRGMGADVLSINIGHTSANCRAIRKVELVGCAMNRIVFDRSPNFESGLLKPEAQAACACEEIYYDWS
ncbi:MAG TPA: hypothetical protein VNO32_35095, partial [Candidatus Acidoferrum sp.]|nr:hypothetical protein [Candidatus Acidoferrum sp.]